MPPTSAAQDAGTKFAALLALMATLRSDDGCPWDREQTHTSLKPYLLEEAYELLDALEADDDDAIVDELGDVLLQVIFHAQIAAEAKRFSMADVIDKLEQKLIRRHPHVFGGADAADPEAVVRTWAAVKRQERTQKSSDAVPASLLDPVPRALPALMEAKKIQQRAAGVGFQWDDISGAWQKIGEELDELRHAAQHASEMPGCDSTARAAIENELGDVLFAVVNVARYLGVDPEQSLRMTNAKFRRRFHYIEQAARAQGLSLEDMSLDQMDALWDEAKRDR